MVLRILTCFKISRDAESLSLEQLQEICRDDADMTGVDRSLGIYDEAALETARQSAELMRKRGGGVELIAFTAAHCEERFSRNLFALGFDQIVQTDHEYTDDHCPEQIAAAVCAYIKTVAGFDLIITGCQTSPGENGQTPYLLSAMLGIPCLSGVSEINLDDDRITVLARSNVGHRRMVVSAPAVISVAEAKHAYLRFATIREKMAAADKKVMRFSPPPFTPRLGQARYVKASSDEQKRNCQFIDGASLSEKITALWHKRLKDKIIK